MAVRADTDTQDGDGKVGHRHTQDTNTQSREGVSGEEGEEGRMQGLEGHTHKDRRTWRMGVGGSDKVKGDGKVMGCYVVFMTDVQGLQTAAKESNASTPVLYPLASSSSSGRHPSPFTATLAHRYYTT